MSDSFLMASDDGAEKVRAASAMTSGAVADAIAEHGALPTMYALCAQMWTTAHLLIGEKAMGKHSLGLMEIMRKIEREHIVSIKGETH